MRKKIKPSTVIGLAACVVCIIAINILEKHHITHLPLPFKVAWIEEFNGDAKPVVTEAPKPTPLLLPGWVQYSDPDNDYRLFYPPTWQVKARTAVATHQSAKYGDLLHTVTFGPTNGNALVTLEVHHAYPNTSPYVTEIRSLPWQYLSSSSATVGGVAGSHEYYADGPKRYDTYTFWYGNLVLHAIFLSSSTASTNDPGVNNAAYATQFDHLARSICFADMFSSGACATN